MVFCSPNLGNVTNNNNNNNQILCLPLRRVGELSLLGAMGCGTWLVKTLLAELEEGELAGEYDVVVLQDCVLHL